MLTNSKRRGVPSCRSSVLNSLERHKLKITFFLRGQWSTVQWRGLVLCLTQLAHLGHFYLFLYCLSVSICKLLPREKKTQQEIGKLLYINKSLHSKRHWKVNNLIISRTFLYLSFSCTKSEHLNASKITVFYSIKQWVSYLNHKIEKCSGKGLI